MGVAADSSRTVRGRELPGAPKGRGEPAGVPAWDPGPRCGGSVQVVLDAGMTSVLPLRPLLPQRRASKKGPPFIKNVFTNSIL